MPGKIVLEFTEGPIQGKVFTFKEHDTFIFGRSSRCHARLSPKDKHASRHHFLLEVNPPMACLRDLGSRNGTYVNKIKYGGRAKKESAQSASKKRHPEIGLKDGDCIRVGRSIIQVQIESPAVCENCGIDIPKAFLPACKFGQDKWICPSCREKVKTAPACKKCGVDIPKTFQSVCKVGENEWICPSCQEKPGKKKVEVTDVTLDDRSDEQIFEDSNEQTFEDPSEQTFEDPSEQTFEDSRLLEDSGFLEDSKFMDSEVQNKVPDTINIDPENQIEEKKTPDTINMEQNVSDMANENGQGELVHHTQIINQKPQPKKQEEIKDDWDEGDEDDWNQEIETGVPNSKSFWGPDDADEKKREDTRNISEPTCEYCGKKIENTEGTVCEICREKNLVQSGPLKSTLDCISKHGYRIKEMLGRGGMGAVYLAYHKDDEYEVAIKFMLSQVAVDDRSRKSFQREIEVMQKLTHPNIVEFFEHGSYGRGFYFVMEYCEGGNLADMAKKYKKKIPIDVFAPIMLSILDGLAFAHQQNIVHRDLKPANILLTESGEPKISDFGLAKNFRKAGFSGMTFTGSVCGTPVLMPREQLANFRYVEPVSDVWSIAATFYNLLTNAYPRDFPRGEDPMLVILERDVVPIRKREPSVPHKIADVIDYALEDNIEDRFRNAKEFYTALAEVV